eukprot:m.70235 g.70235  ORF g.70235 m.70235 type:complete len:83 (+) comp12252_c0_seq3:3950-4198(+)
MAELCLAVFCMQSLHAMLPVLIMFVCFFGFGRLSNSHPLFVPHLFCQKQQHNYISVLCVDLVRFFLVDCLPWFMFIFLLFSL